MDKEAQSPEQILKLAESNQWTQIKKTTNILINEAVRLKEYTLLKPILEGELETALLLCGVKKADKDIHQRQMLVQLLLPSVKNIHAPDKNDGKTILHYAAQNNWGEIVTLLIEKYGAYPNVLDNNGWGPLGYACFNNYTDLALYLVKHGAYAAAAKSSPPKLFTNKAAKDNFLNKLPTEVLNKKTSLPPLPETLSWIQDDNDYITSYDAVYENKLMMFLELRKAEFPFYVADDLIKLECCYGNCLVPQQVSELLKNKTATENTIMLKKKDAQYFQEALNEAGKLAFLDEIFKCQFKPFLNAEKRIIFKASVSSLTKTQLQRIESCHPDVIFTHNEIILNDPLGSRQIFNQMGIFQLPLEQQQKVEELKKIFGCQFEMRVLNKSNYEIVNSDNIDWTVEKQFIINKCLPYCKENGKNIAINYLHLDNFFTNARIGIDDFQRENESFPVLQCNSQ